MLNFVFYLLREFKNEQVINLMFIYVKCLQFSIVDIMENFHNWLLNLQEFIIVLILSKILKLLII